MSKFKKSFASLLCLVLFLSISMQPVFAYSQNYDLEGYFEKPKIKKIIVQPKVTSRRNKSHNMPKEEESAGTLATAGGLALVDGPLPIGDALATGLLIYEGGKLIVQTAPSFFSWLKKAVGSLFADSSDVEDGAEVEVKFPEDTDDMDEILGVNGRDVPDVPENDPLGREETPGRDKKKWKLKDGWDVTHENHRYHENAPSYHQEEHWHVNGPNGEHVRFNPGDTIPSEVWEHLQ